MINFIILQGNLVDKPVYRPSDGTKKPSIWGKIAVNQGTDGQGNQIPAMFVQFTAFGREAETLAQYADKGDTLIVSGRFSEEQSTGNDGKVYTNKKVTGNAKKIYKLPSQNQRAPQQYGNLNQQMNQGLNQIGATQQAPQQYQAQPQQPMYSQTTNANQSMWG